LKPLDLQQLEMKDNLNKEIERAKIIHQSNMNSSRVNKNDS